MKNRYFLTENFQFLEVKFSIYLNRRRLKNEFESVVFRVTEVLLWL